MTHSPPNAADTDTASVDGIPIFRDPTAEPVFVPQFVERNSSNWNPPPSPSQGLIY
jgi:hypothetical protein